MMDMSNMIAAAVAAKLTPEFVEKEIDARVGKLVVDAIDSALRSYSDTGKLIEKSVADALRVESLDLPSYGTTVAAMVKAQVEARVSDLVAGKLAEDVDDLLKLAPKTIKLSEIAADMLKRHDEGFGEVITVIVQRNEYGGAHIYLDDEQVIAERDRYRSEVSMYVGSDGTIANASIRERDIKSTQALGSRYGLAQKIRAFYACGTVIEVDEDSVVTSIGDY